MSSVEILVITEGATEREVGKVLWDRNILSQTASPKPPGWKSPFRGPREGYEQVISALKERNPIPSLLSGGDDVKVLLVFDQEDATSPLVRMQRIESDLQSTSDFWRNISFLAINGFDNLFEHRQGQLHIVLHISNPSIEGIPRRDFDGYILQILQGSYKRDIARRLLLEEYSGQIDDLLLKAEQELTELMRRNGFPWTHPKSWLYAYITVFQYRQSHVWFAVEVVRHTPNDELQRLFAPLIAAWERLIDGGD